MTRWYRWTAIAAVAVVVAVGAHTCYRSRTPLGQLGGDPESVAEAGLTLRNVTLEQPDEAGGLLWKVKAKTVTYSSDRQIADIRDIEGEFYQEGEVIYEVTADRGEIIEDGKAILLRGNIVAIALESDLTLKGQTLEWQPESDLLQVRDGIEGIHPQMTATAAEAQLFNKDQRLELISAVKARTTAAPWLGLETDALTWYLDEARLVSQTALLVEQYATEARQVALDRLTGQQGEILLDEKIAQINGNVRLVRTEPPLEIVSEVARWEIAAQTVVLDQPLTLKEPQQQLTVTADRGRLDTAAQTVYLPKNVRMTSDRSDAQLSADSATWQLDTQAVEATGNVRYRQSNPVTTLSGDKAVGNLAAQTVRVTGSDVITNIVPE